VLASQAAYLSFVEQFLGQLPKGAFLTVNDGQFLNTMTIGWGSIGYIWQKPVIMVMVRHSRFTHELLDRTKDFTVSVPSDGALRKALAMAGSQSGRDIDKFLEAGITTSPAQSIECPIINGCHLFFECRTMLHQPIDPERLDPGVRESCYSSGDYHDLYFGEILACHQAVEKST